MTPLRQKLIDEIQLRGLSIHTQDSYVRSVTGLARFYRRSPDQLNDDQLKEYLLHLLREKKLAVSSLIVAVSGLRFFFGNVLHRSTKAIQEALPRMKKPVLRPKVYSVQEVEQLLNQPKLDRRHRVMFMTAYAAGLRVSELCQLRIADLLGDRHQAKRIGIRCSRHGSWRSCALTGGSTGPRTGCFPAESTRTATSLKRP